MNECNKYVWEGIKERAILLFKKRSFAFSHFTAYRNLILCKNSGKISQENMEAS